MSLSALGIGTRIVGGLGNQLFQFAVGYAAARRLDLPFFVDDQWYHAPNADRVFGLPFLGITTPTRRPTQNNSGIAHRLRQRFLPRLPAKIRYQTGAYKHLGEPHFHYWPAIHDINGGVVLDGYWQSERYFYPYRDEIRSLIQLETLRNTALKRVSWPSEQRPLVMVHIRLGDYLANPTFTAIHGVLDKSYYQRARAVMEKLYPDALFVVFSDEPDRARQFLGDWDKTVFISGESPYEDIALMSLCDHAIIANSTFSWWAAWLIGNLDKTVIAPRQWFTDQHLTTVCTKDILPIGWLSL